MDRGEDRELSGSKSNLIIYNICMVPPILWPGRPDIAKHSATIPCPANAASPCIKTGITFSFASL